VSCLQAESREITRASLRHIERYKKTMSLAFAPLTASREIE
jgi:hypothetical protein